MGKLVKLSTPLIGWRLILYRLSLYVGEAVANAHSWFVRAAEGGYAAAMYAHLSAKLHSRNISKIGAI